MQKIIGIVSFSGYYSRISRKNPGNDCCEKNIHLKKMADFTYFYKNPEKIWKKLQLRKIEDRKKVIGICNFYRETRLFCREKLVVFCVFY